MDYPGRDVISAVTPSADGIFGIPHGILSSPDEWAAMGLGLVATAVAGFYDGRQNLEPIGGAGIFAVLLSLFLSVLAPSKVTDEWHVSVSTVLLVFGGVFSRDGD